MEKKLTAHEGSALYGLLAATTTDIILKTDRGGFITHASPAIERLGLAAGLPMPDMLIGPHLLDLVHPSYAAVIKAEHDAAIRGGDENSWVEFPIACRDHTQQWFEMQIRSLTNAGGQIYGALGVMRSITIRKHLEEQLFTAAMSDPLTRLTNRKAFVSMSRHLVETEIGGSLALFKVDHFKAINMKYGQSVGDRILVLFAELLRKSVRPEDIVSRIGGENFAVLMPRASTEEAEHICQPIIETLCDDARSAPPESLSITVSAGAALIASTVDSTLKRAELALFLAKAKGAARLEVDFSLPQAYLEERLSA